MKGTDFTFFPGCMIPLRHPQIELAARIALPQCGINLIDVRGFSCCPEPWNIKASSLEDWLTLASRNIALAERGNRDLLTLCNGCYSTLKEASQILKENGEKQTISEKLSPLGLSLNGKAKVKHVAECLAEVGAERISSLVRKPLKGLKVAIHHGCHLLRPSRLVSFDDPFNPEVLEHLVEALSCEVVKYDGYTDCCGNAVRSPELSLSMASNKCKAMKDSGADVIVVVCPACFEQFDFGQLEIKRKLKKDYQIPVLHYCQLLAISLGNDPSALGLQAHRVGVDGLMKKIG
ncbi:MAG: heterodisulfide reductase-related iron-sulfur binding cluster [Actinomycetota bacterium]|nr:heterodisulfide reductase-related iron-sulfur binding cluster [Actinomycetota bacterium]